ncbi:MAG: heparinase II/III family protein [Phycisphaerae bacterium]|nr:heparinase II/III family protein [Phycisphaerae bacterium]
MDRISQRRSVVGVFLAASFLLIGCSIDMPGSSERADLGRRHHDHSAQPQSSPPVEAKMKEPVPVVTGEHPRLYFTDAEIPHIKAAMQRDAGLNHQFDELRHQGEAMLIAPPAEYVRDTEKALIQSRLVLSRVSTLAGLYRLTGEERFAERARTEMFAAAKFPDWHPDDFLPDAELINALSVGYDWLYRYLRIEDRKIIADAIMKKGLQPAEAAYKHNGDWTRTESNHNIVGNGGVAIGAIALGEENEKLSRDLIANSRKSLPTALDQYEPDGAWPEGPIYWDYATRYATYYMASLDSGLGTDFDISRWPGFAATGAFRIYSTGPTKKTFNFGDAEETVHPAPFMYWLALQFKKPIYAAHEQYIEPNETTMFGLVWRARLGEIESFESAARKLPLNAMFRGSELAFLRSDWTPDATYVGFKGGTNRGTHRHLDLGSFVLDALGERWALDLGPDDYGLPGYNGSDKRWTYYRCETVGHNTLTINRENQNTDGDANLVGFHSDPNRSYAVVDLTNAYPKAHSVLRGIELLNGRDVEIVDEIDLGSSERITWNFHTKAKIRTEGATATLEQNGKRLRMQILSPIDAAFEVESAEAPSPQKPNTGVSNLTIRLPKAVSKTHIVVLISPEGEEHQVARADVRENTREKTPKGDALKDWIDAGRIRR